MRAPQAKTDPTMRGSLKATVAVMACCGAVLAGCSSSAGTDVQREAAGAEEISNAAGAVDSSAANDTRVLLDGQSYTQMASAAGPDRAGLTVPLSDPRGIAVNPEGTVMYVADAGNNLVRRLDLSVSAPPDDPTRVSATITKATTIAGTGDTCRRARTRNDGCGDGGPGVRARLNQPSAVALSPDGTVLYIADTGSNLIRELSLQSGTITSIAGSGAMGPAGDGGPATAATLASPRDVLATADGTVYISDTLNNRVRAIGPDATIRTIAGTGAACTQPAEGCGDGGAATAAQLSAPLGLSIAGPDSLTPGLLIADSENHRIRRVDVAGQIDTVVGTGVPASADVGPGGRSEQLLLPSDVQTTGPHSYMVTDAGSSTVRAFWRYQGRTAELLPSVAWTLTGSGRPGFAGDGDDATAAELNQPQSAQLVGGVLWIADSRNNRIRVATNPQATLEFGVASGDTCVGPVGTAGANTVAAVPLIPGARGVDVATFGSGGGVARAATRVPGAYGGAGGFARYRGQLADDTVLVFLGCRGGDSSYFAYSTSGAGGGGSTGVVTASAWDASDTAGILTIAGGGGGGDFVAGQNWEPGGAGANGGGQLGGGYFGGQNGTAGEGYDTTGQRYYAGQDGFGGPGGRGDGGAGDSGPGSGFTWNGTDGSGGMGRSGGGGGYGGGAGGNPSWGGGSSGGGSYSGCGDATPAEQLKDPYDHGSVVIGLQVQAGSCSPGS